MKKLPIIESNKRPYTIQQKPRFYIKESENDKEKFNSLKNYDIAISYYTKIINNNKSNSNFLIKRAICYLAKGFYTLALKDALKSIKIDPKYLKGYYIAALSYLEMYDIEKAEKISKDKNQKLTSLIENKKKK